MIRLLTLIFAFTALAAVNSYAGLPIVETDSGDFQIVGFFDLRDRESFIQITNTESSDPTPHVIHIQVFNVGNLCNENNFFDTYTINDTHVYNLRDIITNDGNPSGVVLPDDAYGIFVATDTNFDELTLIGNLRIEDNNGYEYRTNLGGVAEQAEDTDDIYTFNYNTEGGISWSDIVGIMLGDVDEDEVSAVGPDTWASWDIDIYDLNEVPFSCRNVIFACVDQDNPLNSAILENSGDASVVSFEYGINNAIPSTKDAPLLCPNNVISEGFVQLTNIDYDNVGSDHAFVLFIGLNDGNGRGSMDAVWQNNSFPGNS